MLRFGIRLASSRIFRWQVKCLKRLQKEADATLEVIVNRDEEENGKRNWDSLHFSESPSETLSDTVAIDEVAPETKLISELNSDTKTGFETPDFWLDFFPEESPSETYFEARYGVWFLRFGSQHWPYHQSIGVNTIDVEDCSTPLYLIQQVARQDFLVLKQGHVKTFRYSPAKQEENLLRVALDWPAQVCEIVSSGTFSPESLDPSFRTNKIPDKPSLTRSVKIQTFVFIQLILHLWSKLTEHDHWNIGRLDKTPTELIEDSEINDSEIEWFPELEADAYRADPFPVNDGEQQWILCEEFRTTELKGAISYGRDGSGSNFEEAEGFERTNHLSYPYTIHIDGEVYCVPEQAEANQVVLYRMKNDPGKWEQQRILIKDFPALDPTVFQWEDRWWLSCSNKSDGINYALYLWYSDDLRGEWYEHSQNPVKVDVRSSRPAGTSFTVKNTLYRPAQDCSESYGKRIAVNQIQQLTPKTFRETTSFWLEPDTNSTYSKGRHTLTISGETIFIDGKRTTFHWPMFWKNLQQLIPVINNSKGEI